MNRYSIFHAAFGHGSTEQTDGITQRRAVDLDVDLAMFTYDHVKLGSLLHVDALVVTNEAIKAGDSDLGAVTTELYPVRGSLDTGDWFASARGGWAWAGGQTTQTGSTVVDGSTVSSYSETVDSAGLPKLAIPSGDATVGGRSGRFVASATVAHGMYPTFDGDLAVETRASSSVTVALGARRDTTIALTPFVASTERYVRDASSTHETAAGAQLQVGHALPHSLRLDALAAAGRTPYARLDGGREPDGELGGQVMLAVSSVRRGVKPHWAF